jgi:hypothetical protein
MNNTGLKFGGRTEGTPNKITNEIRECFLNLIEMNYETLKNDIESLSPKDRVKALIELAKFVVPTLKAIDIVSNKDNFTPVQINFTNENSQQF